MTTPRSRRTSSTQQQWDAVDGYIGDIMIGSDAVLDAVRHASEAAGLPDIAVSPSQGKMLHILARAMSARRILEIGTLGGYSTIWLARALPEGGRLVTLESEPLHADVARANIARAGCADRVEVKLGAALDTLLTIEGPFDFIFIDADKPNIPAYFLRAIALSRPGSVIIVDNVVRDGDVIDRANDDPNVVGVRKFNELVAHERRVTATTIQTVGFKGYDGFTLALVLTPAP